MGVELIYKDREGYGLTHTGWEVHPKGLEEVLKEAWKLAPVDRNGERNCY